MYNKIHRIHYRQQKVLALNGNKRDFNWNGLVQVVALFLADVMIAKAHVCLKTTGERI